MRHYLGTLAFAFGLPAISPAKPPDLPADLDVVFHDASPRAIAYSRHVLREDDAPRPENRVGSGRSPEGASEEQEFPERNAPLLRRRMPTEPQLKPAFEELLRMLEMFRNTLPLGAAPDDRDPF